LWIREGVTPGTELFGDTQFLCAVAPESQEAAVYDALDGSLRGNRPLPAARSRIETVGRHIVTWQTRSGRQVLALFDPWSGKDLWRRDFEDTAQLALVELDEAAVLEISGKVTILSLADGKVRFETTAERETQVRQIHMIRSRDHYVLIANQSTGGGPGWQQVTPQVIPVHGRVYGYDRQNGKRLWTTQIDRHGIDLHQPGNLPVLTFVSHYALAKKAVPGLDSHFALTCLDKRNGRLAFDNRDFDEQILYVEYGADVEQKQLDLRLFRSVLRLTFTDKAFPDE
jgi:outer membrane protein assembly factor BamB